MPQSKYSKNEFARTARSACTPVFDLEIAGSGRSSADSVMIPGVSRGIPSVAQNFIVVIFLSIAVDFLICHIFLSSSAFYGRISCIHCKRLCDLQINLSLVDLHLY